MKTKNVSKKGGNAMQQMQKSDDLSVNLQNFTTFQDHIQEEYFLLYESLKSTEMFLFSPSVDEFQMAYGVDFFNDVKNGFKKVTDEIDGGEDTLVMDILFEDNPKSDNVLNGGNNSGSNSTLDNLDESTIPSYKASELLQIIKYYKLNQGLINTPEKRAKIELCLEVYEKKSLTSLDNMYLGEVAVSVLLYSAINKVKETLVNEKLQNAGNFQGALGKALGTFASAAKVTHKHIESMPIGDKMRLTQALFGDAVKWVGKQIMLKLRAPEFDLTSISDASNLQAEILRFLSGRMAQIEEKAKQNRQSSNEEEIKKRLKWVLSILDNIDSTLVLVEFLLQLATNANPLIDVKMSDWLGELSSSVDTLKTIVNDKVENILDVNNYVYQPSKEQKMDLQKATALLEYKKRLFQQHKTPALQGNVSKLESRVQALTVDKLKANMEIEHTVLQLLTEIWLLVQNLPLAGVAFDMLNKHFIKDLARRVDKTAFSSKLLNIDMSNVKVTISKVDVGLRTYFETISKYFAKIPSIPNILGFTLPDFADMLSRIGSLVGSVVAETTANLGFVNMALLLIHYVVAASLHSRKNNVTLEKKTLNDVKIASQKRVTSAMFGRKGGRRSKNGGGLLPDIYQGTPATKPQIGNRVYKGPVLAKQMHQSSTTFDGSIKGEVKVLNERVREHIVLLLGRDVSYTKIHSIVKNHSTNEISEDIHGIVERYVDAFDHSIQHDGENAIFYIKKQEPAFENGLTYPQDISVDTRFIDRSTIEPPYVLSIIARSQGSALKAQFNKSFTELPEKLFANAIHKLNLADETDKETLNIVYSVANSFTENYDMPNSLMGGKQSALSRSQVREILEFLNTKRTKDLLLFCKNKNIKLGKNMRKDDIVKEILQYKKQSKKRTLKQT
jgi:hypothetical protein